MDQPALPIADFDYSLPEERIAFFPLERRDESRLLVYRDGQVSDAGYVDLPALIPPGMLLLFNNTRVIEARLLFQKESGGMIEIFCLEPAGAVKDVRAAMQATGPVRWDCMVGGASKWKRGLILERRVTEAEWPFVLTARYVEKQPGLMIVELDWNEARYCFGEVLHLAGAMPLPPYIRRKAGAGDSERYQTVFAQEKGSVAAPTAGLHFTDDLLERLDEAGIGRAWLTLHVGAGTFKPVTSELAEEHEMHAESIEVSLETVERVLRHLDQGIITVGTTSLRTLESLYWLAVKYLFPERGTPGTDQPIQETGWFLDQWEAYELPQELATREVFERLKDHLLNQKLPSISARTRIMIMPGYRIRTIRALITNFHQPRSTLLLLISAITGDDWKQIYSHALQHNYRFLSYGDGSILWLSNNRH